MFIIIEFFPEDSPYIVTDENGSVLFFDTEAEAIIYANENCQNPQIYRYDK